MTNITGNTRIFGILADPIHHVKTPQGINRLLETSAFDGVMVPIHVRSEDLADMVRGLRRMNNLDGFVVTVPHKTAMPALCDELTPAAARIGAVNVVRRTADGRLVGGMLDGEGFVAGLRSAGIEPAGRSAYLAGAGGAASAIAYALAQSGVARLTVANRTMAKAEELVTRMKEDFPDLAIAVGTGDPSHHDLVVNGTSLGLRDGDALPLDVERLMPEQVVAEIIMQPPETPLLRAAAARGCKVHFGAPMLASQVALMAEFMGGPAAKERT
ncbi:shikimate dehydrogenase family protein [Variovorax paradoxus]|uniref:shikimate dehydrogenase (NADP(+)) n=1 Tax=Variovorax paradoxus TaxID=34073 RepID=A0A0H2LQW3_VARPD|nr:shikimate dehydrogenase [Variovorax paradoxus]KLN52703.1 shikimate dehydrogenase [Variovorax paradoxus]